MMIERGNKKSHGFRWCICYLTPRLSNDLAISKLELHHI